MARHRKPRRRDGLRFEALDWPDIRRQAHALGTDGCSGPTLPLFVDCCYQHDIAYRTHSDEFGDPITRGEADARFRACIQSRDILGELSLIAHARYLVLRAVGWWHWRKHRPATALKRGLYERIAELQAARVGDTESAAAPEMVAETPAETHPRTAEASGVKPRGEQVADEAPDARPDAVD